MTTRTIVTSQPDVACDVCARRLLRGEQPDYFIADGQRRLVCELCAPRATHEGWLRETEAAAEVTLPPMRPRRGRSLLDRFLAVTRGPQDGRAPLAPRAGGDRRLRSRSTTCSPRSRRVEAAPAHAAVRRGEHRAGTYLVHAVDAFNAERVPAPRRRRRALAGRARGERALGRAPREHRADRGRLGAVLVPLRGRHRRRAASSPRRSDRAPSSNSSSREEREGNALAGPAGTVALAQ